MKAQDCDAAGRGTGKAADGLLLSSQRESGCKATEAEINQLSLAYQQRLHDIQHLMSWIEEIGQDIDDHFASTSWRVGHLLVALGRKLQKKKTAPASSFRLYRTLEQYQQWKKDFWSAHHFFSPDARSGGRAR